MIRNNYIYIYIYMLEIRGSQNLAKLRGGGEGHKGWEDRREMK